MRDVVKTLGISLGAALTTVGAYHFLVLRGAPPRSQLSADPQGVEADLTSLRQDLDRLSKRTNSELDARLRALEASSRPSALPTSRPGAAPGPDQPATASDPDRLAEFRSLLEEVEKQRLHQRSEETWRLRLRGLGASYTLAEEDALARLAAQYQDDVRAAFPGGSAGSTPEEREATMRRWKELHAEFVKQVTERLTPEMARTTLSLFPEPGAEPKPRDIVPPVSPGGSGR